MSPSLVTSCGGSQSRSCKKPRLVLKTIDVVIEDDEVDEIEVTLWDDAVDQDQPSKDLHKSIFFKSLFEGDDDDEATGRRFTITHSGRITTTSSTSALSSVSNLHSAQNPFLLGVNNQFLPRSSSTTMINDHSNYQLMPMPMAGCTTSSSTSHLNTNKRPQAAAKRIFWGEEVPLMAVPSLSGTKTVTSTAQPLTQSKSMTKDTDVSYSMTAGHSLLITIKPVKGGNAGAGSDESSASAAHHLQRQPRRLLELSSLLNFFQLLVPEGAVDGDDIDGSSSSLSYVDKQKAQKILCCKSPYFLTLLDPSMPRLTNCGYYYRMRYAVYVMVSTSSSTALSSSVPQKFAEHHISGNNWRSCNNNSSSSNSLQPLGGPSQLKVVPPAPSRGTSDPLVLHIGELHVYTIFPKEGGGGKGGKGSNKDADRSSQYFPKWCQPGHIHYENVSFFANTALLNDEELAALQPVTASDISTMVLNFRRTLKLLNSVVINPVSGEIRLEQQQHSQHQPVEPDEIYQHSFESTLLLEQFKYPKCSATFSNTDRTVHQFVRNQVEMFSRYQAHYSSAANGDTSPDLGNCIQEALMKFYSAMAALPVEKKLLPVTLIANNGSGNKEAKNDVDWSTVDDFLGKLRRLRNQATKSKRIGSKPAADKH